MSKPKILIIFLMMIISVIFPVALAQSFEFEYFDGKFYKINYELKNATLTNLIGNRDLKFYVNGTNGELFISFPKSIPIEYGVGLDYPLFVTVNGEDQYSFQSQTDCTFELMFLINGETQININHGYLITGHQLTFIDIPKECFNIDPRTDTEIQRKLKDKTCSNETHHKGFNSRDDVVCISPESHPVLRNRGYLITFPIIDNS